MGDGFYRSKDPTNSIKVLKEQTNNTKYSNAIKRDTYKNTASPLVYSSTMG